MNKTITSSTYVRCLNVGLIRQLADFIDPQEGWKKLAVDIKKPSGDSRYNQFHIRRFESLFQSGKSPTSELLFDWGTTNCTVGDLVDLLIRNEFLAPARLLLPDSVPEIVHILPQEEIATQNKLLPPYDKEKTHVKPLFNQNPEQISSPLNSSSPDMKSLEVSDTRFQSFSFYELKNVTNNFDELPVSAGGNKMGEGGFGVVYKGYINNRIVAVKKLTTMADMCTEELKQQFDQEIKIMAKCQHENLVELLGFSSDSDNFCLVYIYMPNGSLLDRLSCLDFETLPPDLKAELSIYMDCTLGFLGIPKGLSFLFAFATLSTVVYLDGTAPLSWYTRCKIAQGTANGIYYLHTNHHVHRDIKSANVLLDENFIPKVSDFGLARTSEKFNQTVMTSRIVGTTAYMAPEALRGEITPKSDIYSFGVVLLEIITGLPAVDEQREPQLLLDIKEEIEDEEKHIEDYIDAKMNDVDSTSVENMYSIASLCLHEKKNKRPDIEMVKQHLQEMTSL